jgi:hypothetical protein
MELLAMRVTHVLAGGQRAAEISPGVVCIDGHQVTSIAALISVGVTVDEIISTDRIEVSPALIQRAETLARDESSRPGLDPSRQVPRGGAALATGGNPRP